ncbi:MAG TPA: thiol reductant ABC exporter subunit CydD [Rheinheimera sp.]|nr:thiol reductant ABC exporter subunit CydD [Rheinheimera sp.]
MEATALNKSRLLLNEWLRPYRSQLTQAVLAACMSVPCLLVAMLALSMLAEQWLLSQTFSWLWLALCLAALGCRHALLLYKEWRCAAVSRNLRASLRQQLLAKLLPLGPARNQIAGDGALTVQLTETVDALDGYVSRYVPQLSLVVVTPLLISAAVAYYSPLAGGLLLLTAPLVPFFMILVGREASRASSAQLQLQSRLGGRLADFLQHLPVLKRLDATGIASDSLQAASERYRQSTMQVLRMAFLSTAVLELFTALAIALVALYLGLGLLKELPWAKGVVPVAFQPALFILLLAPEFYQPLRQLGNDYHAKAHAEAAALQLQTLWQHPSEPLPSSPESYDESFAAPSALQWPLGQPILQLRQIEVAGSAQPRLQVPQLQIKHGERWLLTGPSGSGKSTLLQLLAGFVPATSSSANGEYLCAGHLINTAQRPWLWQQIAYLTQQAELLPASIRANLQLARSDLSDTDCIEVLGAVGLWQELMQQGMSLDTVLGEQGLGLSGGQQQRLALARVLLLDRAIWLFDEPFAELDADNQQQLAQLIEHLSRGKTLVIASHQTDYLGFVDQQLQLDAGRIQQIARPDPTEPQTICNSITKEPT